MSAMPSQSSSSKVKQPALPEEPPNLMPPPPRPGFAALPQQRSEYFPPPEWYLNELRMAPNVVDPVGGEMKQLLRRHADAAIRDHIARGVHAGELWTDASKSLDAYCDTDINKPWLEIVYAATSLLMFEKLVIRFPELGRTLQPCPVNSHTEDQTPGAGLTHTARQFNQPAPPGHFSYYIDMAVPVCFNGRLHYSGAVGFQAGTAHNPICHYSYAPFQ